MLYLIDTNILISAHKITNPIDIHPTFWKKLSEVLKRPDVVSIDKVKSEIYHLEDELCKWCKENISPDFWDDSAYCIKEYGEVQNWAHTKNYFDRALSEFAEFKNADPYLVAYALNKKRNEGLDITIVTLEVSSPESKREIKLPDVCNHFSIPFINNNNFYRSIGINF